MKDKTRLAYDVFFKDLTTDPDYIEFKKNSVKKHYKEVLKKVSLHKNYDLDEKITILDKVEITIYFNVPDIYTTENRKLNKQLLYDNME